MKKFGALVAAYFGGNLERNSVSRKFLSRAERALKRYCGDTTERELRRAAKRIRPHANYFKWINRVTEELGVVTTLLEGMPTGDPLLGVRELQPGKPDPPDVVGHIADGRPVAFEVTELVDEVVTKHNVQAARRTLGLDPLARMREMVQRVWEEPDFLAAVESLLREKDEKKLYGGPFERYVVVLHTDENLLDHGNAERWLQGHSFAGLRQVTDAYLLFSYSPFVDGCPQIRLQVAR